MFGVNRGSTQTHYGPLDNNLTIVKILTPHPLLFKDHACSNIYLIDLLIVDENTVLVNLNDINWHLHFLLVFNLRRPA